MAKADYINMWHLPPLADDPGPCTLAIQLALLSYLNCNSNLPVTSLLRAASLACGVMTPIEKLGIESAPLRCRCWAASCIDLQLQWAAPPALVSQKIGKCVPPCSPRRFGPGCGYLWCSLPMPRRRILFIINYRITLVDSLEQNLGFSQNDIIAKPFTWSDCN